MRRVSMKGPAHAAKVIVFALVVSLVVVGCGQQPASGGSPTTGGSTAGAPAQAQPAKVYKWRAVSHQMPGTARHENTVVPFCEMVKKASNGRLVIEPYGAGVLFPVADSFDAVKNGTVQMAMVWSGYWAGRDPVFALAGNLPGDVITGFSEHYYRSEKLDGVLGKVYEKHGVKYLGAFDFGAPEIFMSRVPIRSLDDIKGKTIRTAGISSAYYTKLGAKTVSLSAPEIYQALQLGTVDAAEYNDWLVNSEMGLHEVTKYVVEPCLHQQAIDDKALIVNQAAWNELPDDLKAIVLACCEAARYRSAVSYDVGSKKAKLEKWLSRGVEIIQLPAEDVKKAREVAASLLLEYSQKSPECAEYIKTYAKVLNDLGYAEEAKLLGFSN